MRHYQKHYESLPYGSFDYEKDTPPVAAALLNKPQSPSAATNLAGMVHRAKAAVPRLSEHSKRSVTSKSASLVGDARGLLGVKYKWGGNNPKTGLDCSGLTKLIYGHVGVSLPRTARQQARVGQPVNINSLEPGDQVFFGVGKKGVHHTGIYVGNGKYLHAPKTGDVVKISNLSGRHDFAGARRHV